MSRVSDPNTVAQFMENHVWLDIQDTIGEIIEVLRDQLEEPFTYNADGDVVGERGENHSNLLKGQIRGLRDVLQLPTAIFEDLNTTQEQEDNGS